MDESSCRMRAIDDVGGVICDAEGCPFWEDPDRLALLEKDSECAIRYFNLLGRGHDLGIWLLSVSQRLNDSGHPGTTSV